MLPEPDTGLELSISFKDGAVVAVAGELDLVSAADFVAVLDALIDRGHSSITIDCRGLDFIDASGVGILANAQTRLARNEGVIRIHGASPMTYRVFEITDLLDALHVERANPGARREHVGVSESDPITSQ